MANEFDFENMGFDEIFKDAVNQKKQASVKDIADRYNEIFVKCPCCEHTIKIKLKV